MKKTTQLQQGDVLLKRITNIEIKHGKIIPKSDRGIVLAEGEVTGHYHAIQCEESEAELIQIGERILLSVKSPVTIRHEEHGPVTVEPGIWEIGKVREMDHVSEMVRPVVD